MKPAEFARKCGIRESLLRKYLAGSMPGADKLAQIARANGVTLDWLATGEPPAAAGVKASQPSRAYDAPGADSEFIATPRLDIGSSSDGAGFVSSEQVVDCLAFRSEWVRETLGLSPKDLALVSVRGDSMEPTLADGDLVLVDTSVYTLVDSALYLLWNGEQLFVRRIHRKVDGSVLVKSDNSRYETEVYSPDEASRLMVRGRVVWTGRKL